MFSKRPGVVTTRSFAPVVPLVAALAGCGSDPPPPPPTPAVEVTVARAESADTPVVFEFVGRTQSSRRVEIRSRVQGFLEERVYHEGSFVNEGDVLFRMDEKPLAAALQAAQAELAQQTARMETAKANLDRIGPLVERNAVSLKDLDDAEGAFRTAAAAVEAAKANVVSAELDLGYATIRSPVTGLSSFAVQQEGAYVGFGTDSLLTYVAAIDPIWVEFSVSENQLLRAMSEDAEGLIEAPTDDEGYHVEIVLADGSVHAHTGRITFADASISEATGTFMVRAEVANPERTLRPGQFVRVRLEGAYRPDSIVLPRRSIQQGAKGSYVWVIDASGTARFRPVDLGPWHDDGWFVYSGVQDGENVAVDGAIRLSKDAKVTIVAPESSPEPARRGS